MKNILLLITGLLLSTSFLFAQNQRSTIRLRLSDGTPLKVVVNNRNFNKIGTPVVIDDLPGKRPHFMIYRFRPYADGKGGKAELVYSGSIKIKRGAKYDAVVDVRNRKLRLKEIRPEEDLAPATAAINHVQNHTVRQAGEEGVASLNAQLETIHRAMEKVDTDHEKLVVAEKHVGDQIVTEDAAYIASWLFFDDTKMQFIKNIYSKISDKENLSSLKDVFTSEASQQEFEVFLKQQ